ncbi:subtilisin-like protease-like protein [Lophiotrema nucula]|uniref:Subtilisin-like protease-like protein n=1 Tax=Lophiotrema nucula TaxID=690887 RepID=A0A6A5ZFI4_9PLEO|nr:subtilisin-like protease-like protein [Lophiotrema nucula]
MQFFTRLAALAAALPFFAIGAPIVQSAAELVPGKWIVRLSPDLDAAHIAVHHAKLRQIHEKNVKKRDGTDVEATGIENVYNFGSFKGYSGGFDAATIEALRFMPEVVEVEQDTVMTTLELTEEASAPWGLGSISSRTRGAPTYVYDNTSGKGTYSYIVDTGIRTTHEEFEGRATIGYNAVNTVMADNAGHGTHVGGIVGGKTYGVAKKTTIISVKVFEGNSGTTSTVIKGFQWAAQDIVTNNRTSLSVINMSLGGPASALWDAAITSAYDDGVLAVVAAGNEDVLASTRSPARSPEAITVGNLKENDARYNGSSGSNYGPAVDIFAAGTNVLSSYRTNDTATQKLSGTSMASPHIAGLVSYLRGLEGPSTAEDVKKRVYDLGTPDRVTDAKDSTNLIAYNGNGR